ncbi:hypothetical protein C2845_PM13G18760 [Panicum miliaceum]|uniref:Uncharacterized protein n=1 Tax=Panicum miliaceum TaxID=4540 RepID=A0A3L6RKA8_PANMI|nr:hypothetical protein C2845_PM13G18760 [Panicum miliaceum]
MSANPDPFPTNSISFAPLFFVALHAAQFHRFLLRFLLPHSSSRTAAAVRLLTAGKSESIPVAVLRLLADGSRQTSDGRPVPHPPVPRWTTVH